MQSRCGRRLRGFTLFEVLVSLAAVGGLLVILAIYGAEVRRNVGLAGSLANLRQVGAGTFAYSTEFGDRYPAFNWEPGTLVDTPYQDIRDYVHATNSRGSAHIAQAVHLMRLRGGQPDIPIITGWIADVTFQHLVLLDFLNEPFQQNFVVSPGDSTTRGWHDGTLPVPNPDLPISARFRFYSSYETPPTWYSPEDLTAPPDAWISRLAQAGSHRFYTVSSATPLEGRHLFTVGYPSQKVMVFERFARYAGTRVAFFAYPEARIPMLLADGSAHVRTTDDSNRGWNPYSQNRRSITRMIYEPAEWEPPSIDGSRPDETGDPDVVDGHYRWTRWGAGEHGRDFGPEHPPF